MISVMYVESDFTEATNYLTEFRVKEDRLRFER